MKKLLYLFLFIIFFIIINLISNILLEQVFANTQDLKKSKLTYALELNFNLKTQESDYRQYLDYQLNKKYRIRLILRDTDRNADFDFRIYYKLNQNSTIYIGESNKYFSFNYTYKFNFNYPISVEATFIKRENFIQINPAIKLELNQYFHLKYGINNIIRDPNPYLRPSIIFKF
ncbi:MAG: hypothetical protein ACP5O4_03950 [bacterium]